MSRLTEVADAIAAEIETAWEPVAPDSVARCYRDTTNLATVTGRQVRVFPLAISDENASRGENLTTYGITVVVVERYTAADGAGEPSVEWVDERIGWVEDVVYDTLANYGVGDTPYLAVTGHGRIFTETSDWAVCQVDYLGTKLFWSELEFTFREVA